MAGYTDPNLNDDEARVREQAARATAHRQSLQAARDAVNARQAEQDAADEAARAYTEVNQQQEEETQPKQRRRRSPFNWNVEKLAVDNIGARELNTILRNLFRAIALIRQSEASFSDDEFNEISESVLVLVNRIPPLKIVLRLLSPIIGVAQVADKIRKVEDARKHTDTEQPDTTAQVSGASSVRR